jgi:hypothetical protein
MRSPLYVLLFVSVSFFSSAQCLTDFSKLVPEPSLDYANNYGRSFALYDNYLAIGLPEHDSLGRITGIVYLYERIADSWKKIAALAPSDPQNSLQFGLKIKMSSDYILVGAGSQFGGKVYLFKKPPTGWQSQTELTAFAAPGTSAFGLSYHNTIAISDDQQTIAITDQYYFSTNESGAVYVYHKQPGDEWSGTMPYVRLSNPDPDNISDFGRAGVEIIGDRIITGTPHASNGVLYVYRDPTGTFSNLQLEATLTAGSYPQTAYLAMWNFVCTDDGIFTPIVENQGASGAKLPAVVGLPFCGTTTAAFVGV